MEAVYGWGLPPDISTHGWQIDQLIWILHGFMLVLFVGWGIFLAYCLIRFRQRPGRSASYALPRTKFPKALEVGIALFEAFLLIGLSAPVWSKVKREFPPANDAFVVRVVAQQFAWNFHYPGRDGTFGKTDPALVSEANAVGLDRTDPAGADDILTLSMMHLPVNRPVIAHLRSRDVIHSFFIPVLRVKQDVNPGMTIPIWFEAARTGQFEIACAQLCGNGHSLMRGFVVVDSAEDYEKWLQEQESYLAPPQEI